MRKAILEKVTFEHLSKEWLEYKKTTIKESSYLNYKFTIRTKFLSKIGKKSVYSLLSYNFNSLVGDLMKTLSKKNSKRYNYRFKIYIKIC